MYSSSSGWFFFFFFVLSSSSDHLSLPPPLSRHHHSLPLICPFKKNQPSPLLPLRTLTLHTGQYLRIKVPSYKEVIIIVFFFLLFFFLLLFLLLLNSNAVEFVNGCHLMFVPILDVLLFLIGKKTRLQSLCKERLPAFSAALPFSLSCPPSAQGAA